MVARPSIRRQARKRVRPTGWVGDEGPVGFAQTEGRPGAPVGDASWSPAGDQRVVGHVGGDDRRRPQEGFSKRAEVVAIESSSDGAALPAALLTTTERVTASWGRQRGQKPHERGGGTRRPLQSGRSVTAFPGSTAMMAGSQRGTSGGDCRGWASAQPEGFGEGSRPSCWSRRLPCLFSMSR